MRIAKLLLSVFVATSGSVFADDTLVLYDNFNAKRLDPERWFGFSTWGASTPILEAARKIEDGRLHMATRGYGDTATNTGSVPRYHGVNFTRPETVTTIETTVKVRDYEFVGCPGNSAFSQVRARIKGYFFNVTDTPTDGSAEGDLLAQVRVVRDSKSTDKPDVLRVTSHLDLCEDQGCFQTRTLASVDLGSVRVGQKVKIGLKWDRPGHRFVVWRDKHAQVLFDYPPEIEVSPPGAKGKGLDVSHWLANCTQETRTTAFVSAVFDDVRVNPEAAPPDSSARQDDGRGDPIDEGDTE